MDGTASDFQTYLDEATLNVGSVFDKQPEAADRNPLLNGVPYRLFRQSIDLGERRRAGTFFSGTDLSARLAQMLQHRLPVGRVVMDPTCGIGDLLLAYAALLPVAPTLEATLEAWGAQLAGIDLRPDLVGMTKARLVMLARARGGFLSPLPNMAETFPRIVVGDMLQSQESLSRADGFLFNPPFGQTSHHAVDTWATGKVNSAAIFLARLVESKRAEAPIAAILPEVLRSGTRYHLFRQRLEAIGLAGKYDSLGRFDSWTDVDVFMTMLVTQPNSSVWKRQNDVPPGPVVGDRFDVRVGSVVPHRHPKLGGWRKFICAKSTPAWTTDFEPKVSRRFKGTAFKPPFVVVRRTSSPSDKKRAVGAIVIGADEVAVENHLIVLAPKKGGVKECQRLLRVLHHDDTSHFLNELIRCRHLTTASVMAIPWANADA